MILDLLKIEKFEKLIEFRNVKFNEVFDVFKISWFKIRTFNREWGWIWWLKWYLWRVIFSSHNVIKLLLKRVYSNLLTFYDGGILRVHEIKSFKISTVRN